MSDKLPKNLSNFPDLRSISLGEECGPECHEEGHNPLLELKDLSVSYGQNTVLSEVSFKLGSGQLVGIIGPNGAGKSTLIKSILGLTPYRGRVLVNGLPAKQARLKLAYVPQKEEVRWDYPVTVEDVVMMGRYRRIGWVRGPRKDDHVVVEEALESVDMLPLKHRQISQLSGGQQQRVFVARALAQQGEIILLDEPLTGVDTTSQEVIINIIKHQRKHGKLILMATHDLNAAARECDNIACINRGLIALGTSRQVFTPEILARTYGGRAVSLQGESSTFILD